MLVLSRREAEWIQIGEARVRILDLARGRVSVGIEAPRDLKVLRGEVVEREREQKGAA